jgi:hypothetical protein
MHSQAELQQVTKNILKVKTCLSFQLDSKNWYVLVFSIPILEHLLLTMRNNVSFEILMTMEMSILVFWVVKQCGLVGTYIPLFLQNVGIYLQVHMALQPRRPTLMWEIIMTMLILYTMFEEVKLFKSSLNMRCFNATFRMKSIQKGVRTTPPWRKREINFTLKYFKNENLESL